MINPQLNNIYLSKNEYTLYAKHLKLYNIGLEGQKRLKKAKVLIIGAGGLGCPAILYSVVSGVGCIGIIDDDYIDISNLNRQILYNISQINTYKVIAAKSQSNKINPYCKIIIHNYKLNKKNALEIIQYYDIIIDATDNFNTRYIIDKICFELHKIHIYGAIERFESQICVFNYKNYIRYSHIYKTNITNLNNNNCYNNGILGITTGNTGILQATEAIKIILGIGKIIYNKLLISNLIDSSIKAIRLYKTNIDERKKILLESDKYIIPFISEEQIKNLRIKHLFVDIREIQEFRQKHIKNFINIPLKKFKSQKTIKFLTNYNQIYPFIIFCKNNNRSIIVSKILNIYKIKHLVIKNKE